MFTLFQPCLFYFLPETTSLFWFLCCHRTLYPVQYPGYPITPRTSLRKNIAPPSLSPNPPKIPKTQPLTSILSIRCSPLALSPKRRPNPLCKLIPPWKRAPRSSASIIDFECQRESTRCTKPVRFRDSHLWTDSTKNCQLQVDLSYLLDFFRISHAFLTLWLRQLMHVFVQPQPSTHVSLYTFFLLSSCACLSK